MGDKQKYKFSVEVMRINNVPPKHKTISLELCKKSLVGMRKTESVPVANERGKALWKASQRQLNLSGVYDSKRPNKSFELRICSRELSLAAVKRGGRNAPKPKAIATIQLEFERYLLNPRNEAETVITKVTVGAPVAISVNFVVSLYVNDQLLGKKSTMYAGESASGLTRAATVLRAARHPSKRPAPEQQSQKAMWNPGLLMITIHELEAISDDFLPHAGSDVQATNDSVAVSSVQADGVARQFRNSLNSFIDSGAEVLLHARHVTEQSRTVRVRIACAQQSHDTAEKPYTLSVMWNESFEFRIFTSPAGTELLLKLISSAAGNGGTDLNVSAGMDLEAKIREIEQRKKTLSTWLVLGKTHRLRVSMVWNRIQKSPGRALSDWKQSILYVTVCSVNGIELQHDRKLDSKLYAKFIYGDIMRDTIACQQDTTSESLKLGTSLAIASRNFHAQPLMIEVWERSKFRDDVKLGHVMLNPRTIDRLCRTKAELTITEEHALCVRPTDILPAFSFELG
jgi:hypothetical protein